MAEPHADNRPDTGLPATAEADTAAAAAPAVTAGRLLREAREAQGLHIAALAAALKVPTRKLEALEADRYDELPDASFTRALALTVCRALKIESAPVLQLLPRLDAGLYHVTGGLNTPFRDPAGSGEPVLASVTRHPGAIIVAVLLVSAAVLWFWPRGEPQTAEVALPPPLLPTVPSIEVVPADPAGAASEPVLDDVPAAPPAASAPDGVGPDPAAVAAPAAEAVPAPVASAPDGPLLIRARQDTWVQVVDGTDRILASRTVPAGGDLSLDGAPPLRLTIGNAASTEVSFRGKTIDLAPLTVGNVARVELK